MFVLAAVGGVAVGLAMGPPLHWLRRRLTQPVLENTLSLATPFAAYFVAESFHASGVLAVVVLGLYLGHTEAATSYAARLQARAVWRMIDFLLESVVFALIGLQLPAILDALSGRSPFSLAWYAALVLVLVIVVRILWVFPFTYGPRWLSKKVRERDPSPRWQVPAVISWAGMRGVVSLAAAFALPSDFPARDLVLFLTFAVVLGTLVLHGFTLPWVIRKLGVQGDESYQDNLAQASAQHRAVGAAINRLDELVQADSPPPEDVVQRLRTMAEHRRNSAWEQLGGGTGPDRPETPSDAFRRLRREMIDAERHDAAQGARRRSPRRRGDAAGHVRTRPRRGHARLAHRPIAQPRAFGASREPAPAHPRWRVGPAGGPPLAPLGDIFRAIAPKMSPKAEGWGLGPPRSGAD